MRRAFVCVLSLFFLRMPLVAENFPFTPPANFTFDPATVAVHHPVKTDQMLAQLYFDQGLTFIYAFNHDAAYWSFLRASEVDPGMAMSYWGMALALGSNINMQAPEAQLESAYRFITKARELSSSGPEVEKDYIEALAVRYSQDSKADSRELAGNYSRSMAKLTEKYPDDPDAATLYAESLLDVSPWNQWTLDGKPLEGTLDAVQTLTRVLREYPDHLGANHYYIHAVEASKHPERALACADRLHRLLPSSGHILHMPAHIYLLLGDYRRAALANEEAIAADREYVRKYGLTGIYPVHYLTHNLYFLSRAYSMAGRFSEAKDAADQLQALYLPHFSAMPELEYYAPTPLFVFLRFHRWNEVLSWEEPDPKMKITAILRHFGRAVAYANTGEHQKATQEMQLFNEKKKDLPGNPAYGYNTIDTILTIARLSAEAEIAFARGAFEEAADALNRAIQVQDTLRYNEPPDWFFPLRERAGGFLLRRNKPGEAERMFREDLAAHPRNGRALFGLRESLQRQNREYDFYWVDAEYRKAWEYSSERLTIDML